MEDSEQDQLKDSNDCIENQKDNKVQIVEMKEKEFDESQVADHKAKEFFIKLENRLQSNVTDTNNQLGSVIVHN